MPQYYVLVKRKGAKNWLGALPSRKGVNKEKFKTSVKQKMKKGFTYKIINSIQLKKILTKLVGKFKLSNKKTR